MRIPRYWSKATAEEDDRDGGRVSISCWRSSDASPDEAHELARTAAQRALAQLLRGERLNRYAYGQQPLREEVLNSVTGSQGEPFLAVTRNHYGAVILNTARVAFIDLDFPPPTCGRQLKQLFARWFGKPALPVDAQLELEIWQRLEQFVAVNPGHGFRVYRTFAGLRAIATHDLYDPVSPATVQTFQALGADPLYVRLCKLQASFRARLTPKPWRCGCCPNPVRWPREDPGQQTRFEEWDAEYTAAQEKYATCRLLGTLGVGEVRPEIAQVIQVHDRLTRCGQPLPLA
ncbi:MAG: hypothetical protein GX575_05920 [Candidatus Anammoximicrobium sp.]|mgnify:CR=1 FL=1|nr:hypothetical protein [Candidatus Anammoximicrobium sp.]